MCIYMYTLSTISLNDSPLEKKHTGSQRLRLTDCNFKSFVRRRFKALWCAPFDMKHATPPKLCDFATYAWDRRDGRTRDSLCEHAG